MSDNFFQKDEDGMHSSQFFHCEIARYPELAEAINFVGFLDEDDSMAAYELVLHNNIKNADLKNLLKKGD